MNLLLLVQGVIVLHSDGVIYCFAFIRILVSQSSALPAD